MRWMRTHARRRRVNALSSVLLTVCIATYNRASFLPATLHSIVRQLAGLDDVEVLVVDGNSTDATEAAVREIQAGCPHLKYLKLQAKGGVDKDFDIAVQNSAGRYCWLFTDDDLLKDGAIAKVRDAVLRGGDLFVVNAEVCDYDVRRVLKRSALPIDKDVTSDFAPAARETFFKLCGTHITFIGAIVIRKAAWTQASREAFYGSRFIHVGVISTLGDATRFTVMAEPLIQIRLGNAEWTNIAFRVWTQLWPGLIWSFGNLSDECKRAVCSPDPWKSVRTLVWYRAIGTYSMGQYADHLRAKPNSAYKAAALLIAWLPQWLVRGFFRVYAAARGDQLQMYCLGDGGRSRNSWFSKD